MPVEGDNSLFFRSGIDNTGLVAGSASAVGIISNLAKRIAAINPFAILATGAALVFGQIASAAFAFAKKYETAMLEVKTISAAVREDFEGMKSAIFRLSEETLDDPQQLAKAYYQIVSAGYDGAKGLRLLEAASKAAVGGVTTTEVAADGLTTAMNAFGIAAEDVNEVADTFFKTVELGKTNFEQLSSNLATVAPIASVLGVSLQEVMAAVASLTKQGTPTSVAMTQIRSALIGMNEELGEGWSRSMTLQEGFQELYDRAGGSATALREIVGRVEAVNAVMGTAGEKFKGAVEDLKNVEEAVGSADRAFRIMTEGQENALQILGNRVRALAESIGNDLLAVANDAAQFLLDLSDPGSFQAEVFEKERIELQRLKRELRDAGTAYDRKVEIIDQLKQKYPAFLENIKNEGVFTREIELALRDVNDQFLKRIALANNEDELGDAYNKYRKFRAEQQAAINDLQAELDKVRDFAPEIDNYITKRREQGAADIVIAEELARKDLNRLDYLWLYIENVRNAGKEVVKFAKEVDSLSEGSTKLSQGILEFGNTGGAEQQAEEGQKALEETFAERLSRMKQDFEAFEAAKQVLGEEGAKKQFKSFTEEYGERYTGYLMSLLSATADYNERKLLYFELADQGVRDLLNRELEAVKAQAKGITDGFGNFADGGSGIVLPAPILEIDDVTVGEIDNQIREINKAIEKAQGQSLRNQLLALRKNLEDQRALKLNMAQEVADEEAEIMEQREAYALQLLLKRLAKQRKAYRDAVREFGKHSDEANDVLSDMRDTQQKIFDQVDRITERWVNMFNNLSDAFDKFGNEELAKIAEELADVASGIGALIKGFASGNPLAIIGGLAEFVSKAIKVEIVADTEKFEKQIRDLERSISRLENTLSLSLGEDKIQDRRELIDLEREVEEARLNAAEAERKARKEVKLLGITLGRKGEGSGADPEKIREFEDAAEAARLKVIELEQQIRELYTGTTSDQITNDLVRGFEDGKKSAADFADNFEDLMRQAIIESLKLQYLEKAIDKFYKEFADKAQDDDGLTAGEIAVLRQNFNDLVDRSKQELEALNEILAAAGIGPIGADINAQGLSGNIQTITEDTANVLAGTLNKIMVDVAAGLEASQQALFFLSQINAGVARLADLNETANVRLLNIENSLA